MLLFNISIQKKKKSKQVLINQKYNKNKNNKNYKNYKNYKNRNNYINNIEKLSQNINNSPDNDINYTDNIYNYNDNNNNYATPNNNNKSTWMKMMSFIIGSLIFLTGCISPDIAAAVNLVVRKSENQNSYIIKISYEGKDSDFVGDPNVYTTGYIIFNE
ncbi:hypothetical protein H8356DRAFT_1324125 [Neocallimastix lanati (nom. inval.)]|nr:hypothetical protein H8356DRAFT_1324125 [Neocallimastix sp. JGI-2020a]